MNAVHHHPHPHHGGHHSHSHTDMPPPTSTGSVQDSQMFSPPNMVASKAQVHAQQQALAQAQAAAQVVANAMRGGDKFGQQQQQQQQHSQQHHQQQQHHQHHQQQQQQTPNHQQHSHQHGQHTPSHQHGQHTPSQHTPNLQHTPTHHMNGSMGNMGGMGSLQNGMPPPQSTVSPTHKAAVVSATTPSATPTQNDISHAAEKVLQRAEISRMTRNLKSRLKLATFKTKRGWENLTFDTIEPRVDEEIKPMSPSSASSNTAGSANANATRSMYMTTTDQLSSPPLQQPFHPLSTPRFPPGNYPGSVHGPGGPQSPATLYDMGSPKAKMDHYPMLSPAKVPETRKRARTITSAPGTTASPRLHYSKSYQQLPFAMSQQHQQHALQQQQQHMFEQQQQVGFAQSQPMAKSQSMGALSQMKLSRDEIMNIDSELDKRERREREREQQQQQQQHQHQQEQQHQQQQHQHQQQQHQQQHQRQHSHDESSQASHSLSNSSSQSAHSLGAALAGRSLEPPRTPPQKPRKLGVGSRDDANRDEGADLLMYLATSPSPAQRPSSSQPPWGASGGTPVQPTSAAAPQTPSQNFNFNDYLHMMTPSPAQVSHSPYHTERTPSTPNRLRLGQIPRSARRRLNFDKIPASPTSSERDSR